MISAHTNIIDAVVKELRTAMHGNKDLVKVIDKIFERRFYISANSSSGYILRCYSYGMVHFVGYILMQNKVFNFTSYNNDVMNPALEFYKSLISMIISSDSCTEIKLIDFVNTIFISDQVDLSENSIVSYFKNLGKNYNAANKLVISSNNKPPSGRSSLQQNIYKRIHSLKYWDHEIWRAVNWQKSEEILKSICIGIIEYVENTEHISFSEITNQMSSLNLVKINLEHSEYFIIERPTKYQLNIMLRLGIPRLPRVLKYYKTVFNKTVDNEEFVMAGTQRKGLSETNCTDLPIIFDELSENGRRSHFG